jgi:LysR family transcriptional regulator, positive regulator for ilvC
VPELDALRAAVDLASTLNFGATARALHVSPSTLSRTIAALERELDAPLFVRDTRRVALTGAGEQVVRWAADTLAGWDRLRRDLRTTTAPLTGSLAVYCTVTASQTFVPGLLARFRRAHPEVEIHLETGYASDALERVQSERVAVSVAVLPARVPRSVVAREIASTPLVMVAPRPAPTDEIDWAHEPVVLPAHGVARDEADRWFRARRVRPRIVNEVEGHEALLALVGLGCGTGIVPRLVLDNSALRDRVEILDVDPPLPMLRIGLCALRRSLDDPVVAELWRTLS